MRRGPLAQASAATAVMTRQSSRSEPYIPASPACRTVQAGHRIPVAGHCGHSICMCFYAPRVKCTFITKRSCNGQMHARKVVCGCTCVGSRCPCIRTVCTCIRSVCTCIKGPAWACARNGRGMGAATPGSPRRLPGGARPGAPARERLPGGVWRKGERWRRCPRWRLSAN